MVETTRSYRWTAADTFVPQALLPTPAKPPRAAAPLGSPAASPGGRVGQPVEVQVTGTHVVHGNTYYSCSVGWMVEGGGQSLQRRLISKRYSEFVTLDRKFRKGGGGLSIGDSDAMLPRLLDRSTVGRNSEEVITERGRELEEWLQLATLHPLVSVSAQLRSFLGQDVFMINDGSVSTQPL